MRARWGMIVGLAALPALGACQMTESTASIPGGAANASVGIGGSEIAVRPKGGDEDLALGKEHFRNANYGLAEKHFRAAVEKSQNSLEALVGLAASYDQLGRFDLADRAYTEAFRIGGPTSALLNNRGYSHYLRRDVAKARADFQAALRADPNNAMAKRNLALVRA